MISRNTANKCSRIPWIILPSTNASAGAFSRRRWTPLLCCIKLMPKSRKVSKISRASSVVLPVFSTASAQLRKTRYTPRALVSSSVLTSSCDRTSRLPSGFTEALIRFMQVPFRLAFQAAGNGPTVAGHTGLLSTTDTSTAWSQMIKDWRVSGSGAGCSGSRIRRLGLHHLDDRVDAEMTIGA